ncbi:hypothetical protein AJ80_02623 [Polytolypa hystricis UAMH7299]|uniref:Trafficking protein particle complex subunit 12 n=1 Tax=Polytolypa hystricis (strain UAMH7299) TaxID=1447883 RepID=A0A2B7YQC5_POLH7|nr:hypothetical protein AJ80_02623 [Polytolypa hystricis UAMH7299]
MTPSGPKHRHTSSIKASRPRSSTKGPLDAPDENVLPTSAAGDTVSSPRSRVESPIEWSHISAASSARNSTFSDVDTISTAVNKNFSFLLRPDIFHPLSQLEISPAFREKLSSPSANEPSATSLATLDKLLNNGHFLHAAHFSAAVLTSSALSPTDHESIFSLLYIRLACLELTGNTLLAAQEAKALEDLSSSFYFIDAELDAAAIGQDEASQARPRHIVPWPLRVLAVRLQSIGFGDARRGIQGLYELGLEPRRELSRNGITAEEKVVWKSRLEDLGIRVVNALVEMGDLDGARRSLASLTAPSRGSERDITRMALLYLKVGDVDAARKLLESRPEDDGNLLHPLLSMAEGKYDEAVMAWKTLRESNIGKPDEPLISQNLAVCLLYTGKLNESRDLLESLIESNHSFQSLTFNLATVYELSSDKSRALKLRLTERIAKHPPSADKNWERPNVDFKI